MVYLIWINDITFTLAVTLSVNQTHACFTFNLDCQNVFPLVSIQCW